MKEIHFFSNHWRQIDWECQHKYVLPKYHEGAESIFCETCDYDKMDEILNNRKAKEKKPDLILTTQMCFLQTDWLELGYKIFVHDNTGDFEIKLGDGNERTDRFIRMGHNLFKIWKNGGFDNDFTKN